MSNISVPIILRNFEKLKYPVDRVIKSVEGLVDEVILAVDRGSTDFSMAEAGRLSRKYPGLCKVFCTNWDMSNIKENGEEFSKQTNIAIDFCRDGNYILLLQADEAIHEKDFPIFSELASKDDGSAYEMLRLYFYKDMNTIRSDWTVHITRFFRKGSRYSCGDAMNTEGNPAKRIKPCIYHYSRIGDPQVITKRILSLDQLFHDHEKLLDREELSSYDFSTYNFDCMHKDHVDVGRKKVESKFIRFMGTHPKAFEGFRSHQPTIR